MCVCVCIGGYLFYFIIYQPFDKNTCMCSNHCNVSNCS